MSPDIDVSIFNSFCAYYRVSLFHIHVQNSSLSFLETSSLQSFLTWRVKRIDDPPRRIEDERFNKTARSKRASRGVLKYRYSSRREGLSESTGRRGSSFVLTRRLSVNERFDGSPRKGHKGNEISRKHPRGISMPPLLSLEAFISLSPPFVVAALDPLTRYKLIYSRKDGINAAGRVIWSFRRDPMAT